METTRRAIGGWTVVVLTNHANIIFKKHGSDPPRTFDGTSHLGRGTIFWIETQILHGCVFERLFFSFSTLYTALVPTTHTTMHHASSNVDGFVHIQLLSMVNALKTGDPTVDMFLAMILPYLIGQFSKDIILWIKNTIFRSRKKAPVQKTHERRISYRAQRTSDGTLVDLDQDNYNMVLIKAIQLYVDKNCELQLHEAEMDLTSIETTRVGDNNHTSNLSEATSTAKLLQSFHLVERAPPRTFHQIGTFGGKSVLMKLDDSLNGGKSGSDDPDGGENSSDSKGVRNIQITLRSSSKQAIHSFIQTAYQWYTNQLVAIENKDRYYFDLKRFDIRPCKPSFQRYVLGDEKTFDTLFSQQSHSLKKIVDQFESKTGRYRIQGYPHKLGLLLSGLPGTGKTSLIKALAHYLNRHIVNIPLSRISTNAELMALLFNQKYPSDDYDSGALNKLDFKKVIFVLEDVDAGSPVVKSRVLIQAEEEAERRAELEARAAVAAAAAEGNEANASTTNTASPVVSSRVSKTVYGSDALDLTGLLNALDGVVETPGRIVIMTTNHPEMLDSALTRPGRIDKQLVMGYMIVEDIVAMINHYYETQMNPEQKGRLQELVNEENLEITAAELECTTAESDTVDELLVALWERSWRKGKELDGPDETMGSYYAPTDSNCDSDCDRSDY